MDANSFAEANKQLIEHIWNTYFIHCLYEFGMTTEEERNRDTISHKTKEETNMAAREHEIRIKLSNDEHEMIRRRAKEVQMQVAPYLRLVAKNPVIKPVDFSAVMAHTKALSEIRASINQLIFTIEATNNYLPREIESIVNMMNAVFRTENELLKTVREIYTRKD